jgi:hypothetical protein
MDKNIQMQISNSQKNKELWNDTEGWWSDNMNNLDRYYKLKIIFPDKTQQLKYLMVDLYYGDNPSLMVDLYYGDNPSRTIARERQLRTVYLKFLGEESFLYNHKYDQEILKKAHQNDSYQVYLIGKRIIEMGLSYYGDNDIIICPMTPKPESIRDTPKPESIQDTLPQPQKIKVSIRPWELVACQTITLDNCNQWVEYAIKNCTDSKSFMKVTKNGFFVGDLEEDTFQKFNEKIIQLDLVDVFTSYFFLHANVRNKYATILDMALEHESYNIVRYLVSVVQINFKNKDCDINKYIIKSYQDSKYERVHNLITNVYLILTIEVEDMLIDHPSDLFLEGLMEQDGDLEDKIITNYMNNHRRAELKAFINKYF